MKAQWDKVAKKYDKLIGETGDPYHKTYLNPVVLKLLGSVKGKKVLDLACGQGYFSRILARKGAKVTGLDISRKLLDIARTKSKNITYIHNDSANIKDVKTNSQDVIVSNMAFFDIKNIKDTIKECARVLKKGGALVFSILHPITHGKVERYKDKQGYYLKLRDYHGVVARKSTSIYWKDELLSYFRPLGYYTKLLFDNNFTITDLREIYTKHDMGKSIKDKALLAFKQEIPSFMVIKALLLE